MSCHFRHYELPSRFAEHYRPLRVHRHEKGLAAFALDEYGLRFFRLMATASPVPKTAIWSLVRHPAECRSVQLLSGQAENPLGYVVCEIPYSSADPAAYPVPRRLTYRAKVTIATLQSLLHDLAEDPADTANVIAFIKRRINQLSV